MADYKIIVADIDDTNLGEIVNFSSISFRKRLNNYGECSLKLFLNDPTLVNLISLRRYQVKIYRDNRLVWAGEQAHRSVTLDDTKGELVTLVCYDYIEQFNNRYTLAVVDYNEVDAGQIAWDLIDDSQNLTDGDLGITQGTIESTQERIRSYYNQNIMEAIINLSNVIGGFDFEITDDKVFNVYSKKGLDRSANTFFEYGVNMQSPQIEDDFTNPVNEAIMLGEGFGATQLRTTVVNPTARSVNKLRQFRVSDPDVSESDTLYEKGEEVLRRYKQPLINITFKQVQNTRPFYGSIELGDSISIKIVKGIYNINNVFRVYEKQVDLDNDGKESIEYLVSLYT